MIRLFVVFNVTIDDHKVSIDSSCSTTTLFCSCILSRLSPKLSCESYYLDSRCPFMSLASSPIAI